MRCEEFGDGPDRGKTVTSAAVVISSTEQTTAPTQIAFWWPLRRALAWVALDFSRGASDPSAVLFTGAARGLAALSGAAPAPQAREDPPEARLLA